jgi:diaminopimelate decarboxylase
MTHVDTPAAASGDDLLIGGEPVRLLAERVGSTPFYAYDRGAIARRIAKLRADLPRDVRIHYAMKANPMPAVVQYAAGLVDGIDVASAKEMLVALDAGVSSEHISFAGPGKTEAEVRRAVAAGITLNVESDRELAAAIAAGEALGKAPRVAMRVNPSFELKSAGMKMGGAAKQFGIDAERAPEILRQIEASGASFEGFHIFSGSQNLRAEAIIEAQAKTIELLLELAALTRMPVKTANIGGGFGIPYAPGDKSLDLPRVGEALDRAMAPLRARLPDTSVAVELGRYIVGEAGFYVCKVIDRKVSRGQVFLVTDGGLHHHLAATGNFGQVIRRNYPLLAATKMRGGAERETVNVVGPLCTPLDLLGNAVELPRLEPGDLVAILQSGAYGLTASPTAFLSHPAPAEILV